MISENQKAIRENQEKNLEEFREHQKILEENQKAIRENQEKN